MNNLNEKLIQRCENSCELCASEQPVTAYAVSPENHDSIANEVAVCSTCLQQLEKPSNPLYWQCLAGSIWNTEPAVQALSYRILYGLKDEQWAGEIITGVEPDEAVINWALSVYAVAAEHTDSNGQKLQNGDTVVLTQQLNVKGASFNAPKGTIVRKIRLVPDNTEQVEGKINDETIVILTKYVRKS
ncbi:MAG: PhnA protein [Chitinophagaceae bacterium]|nr:PhnA protein [Chitinophagaceae bacterium]